METFVIFLTEYIYALIKCSDFPIFVVNRAAHSTASYATEDLL